MTIRYSEAGRRVSPPVITRLMAAALDSPDLLSLAAGFTDTATLPRGIVREVTDRLLDRKGPPEILQYGTNQGRPLLRELLASRLALQDGMPEGSYPTERIFITNGSQQALALAIESLCDPGDIVLVEEPTYFVFLDVLRGFGARAVSIPSDSEGKIDGPAFQEKLSGMRANGDLERVKAVYLVTYFANPSSITRTGGEKEAVLDALAGAGIRPVVLEDGAYRELYFNEPAPEPSVLASNAIDEEWPRLYLGTLTKPFATGLKVGFGYSTDAELLGRMLCLKGIHDFGTANFNQAILEEVLAGGHFDRYLADLRSHYAGKMRALSSALKEEGLPDLGWRWKEPAGGLYLWLTGPERIDTGIDSAFCHNCLANGVLYVPGGLCFGEDAPDHHARLSFGVLPPDSLREAGKRFAAGARRFN